MQMAGYEMCQDETEADAFYEHLQRERECGEQDFITDLTRYTLNRRRDER